jgi:hypothetical protein
LTRRDVVDGLNRCLDSHCHVLPLSNMGFIAAEPLFGARRQSI